MKVNKIIISLLLVSMIMSFVFQYYENQKTIQDLKKQLSQKNEIIAQKDNIIKDLQTDIKNQKIPDEITKQLAQKDIMIKNKDKLIRDLEIMSYLNIDNPQMSPTYDSCTNEYNNDIIPLIEFDNTDNAFYFQGSCYMSKFLKTNRGKRIRIIRNIVNLEEKVTSLYIHVSPSGYEEMSEEGKKDFVERSNERDKILKQLETLRLRLKELNKLIEQEDKLID